MGRYPYLRQRNYIELIESFEKSDSDLLFVKHPSRTNPEEEYKFLIAQKFKNENTVKTF